MSSSSKTVKVGRLGVQRKDGHDHFKYQLYSSVSSSSSSSSKDIIASSISGRFSQYERFSVEVIRNFPWLAVAPLVSPLIPQRTISKEEVKDRELNIQTMLYNIANGEVDGDDADETTGRANNHHNNNQPMTSPLSFLLSWKDFVVVSNHTTNNNETLSPPSAEEIDNLIASSRNPSSSSQRHHHHQDCYEHQSHFDINRFLIHLQAWNSALHFAENVEKETSSLQLNFQTLATEIYGNTYLKTLDDFSETFKRFLIETGSITEADADAVQAAVVDFDDDDDENVLVGQEQQQQQQQQQDLAPPPPRPDVRNGNDDDDDDVSNNHQNSSSAAPKPKKETPLLVDKREKNPLEELVTIGAVYNIRGTESIPIKIIDVTKTLLAFIAGGKELAKRRRDKWNKMLQTLLEAQKMSEQAVTTTRHQQNNSSGNSTNNDDNDENQQGSLPLDSHASLNHHQLRLDQQESSSSTNNNNKNLISFVSLISGVKSRHESEAEALKELIRESSDGFEKLFEASFRNFRILFEKIWNDELIPNIVQSVTAKPEKSI